MANALIAFANPFSSADLETHEEERLRGVTRLPCRYHYYYHYYHHGHGACIHPTSSVEAQNQALSTNHAENGWGDAKKKQNFKILPTSNKQRSTTLWLSQTGIFTSVLFQIFTNSWKERCQNLGKKVIQYVSKRRERKWLIGHSGNG